MGLVAAALEDLEARGVRLQPAARRQLREHGADQHGRRLGSLLDPVADRAQGQVDALPSKAADLTVQRDVVGILVDDDLGDQAVAGQAPLDDEVRAFGGDHARARVLRTRTLLAQDAQPPEVAGDVLDALGFVLAKGLQRIAALRTDRVLGDRAGNDLLRQFGRRLPAPMRLRSALSLRLGLLG